MKFTWTWTGEKTDIEAVLKCVGEGWKSIITVLCEDLFTLGWDGKVTQVKEKFGGLRFYCETDSIDSKFHGIANRLIQFAEDQSYYYCEVCGKHGSKRSPKDGGWIKTFCRDHAVEFGYVLKNWEKESEQDRKKA